MTATIEIYGDKYDIAVSTQTARIIFKCKNKNCKHVYAKEYRKVFTKMSETIWPSNPSFAPYHQKAVFQYHRFENGRVVRYESDCECPCCHRHAEANIVAGVKNDAIKCNARCQGAKNGPCECECGGLHHGISHMS